MTRIFSSPPHLDLSRLVAMATRDYNIKQLQHILGASTDVHNVVALYLSIANGKSGITLAANKGAARVIADMYCANNVPAAVMFGTHSQRVRHDLVLRLRCGGLKQIVTVGADIDGRFDVIVLAAPTKSLTKYAFWCGLAAPNGIIIDCANNVACHGYPQQGGVQP